MPASAITTRERQGAPARRSPPARQRGVVEIVGLSQPNYLPWPGHLDLISRCSEFYFYDDTQYTHGRFRARNRVLLPSGPVWLTVPVLRRGRGRQRITDVDIDNGSSWRRKHQETLRHAYSRQPYWPLIRDQLETLYAFRWERLVDLSIASTRFLLRAFGINTPLRRSSSLGLERRWHLGPGRWHRSLKFTSFADHTGARSILEGESGRPLLDPDVFRQHDVCLKFHRYSPPGYAGWPAGAVPGLSALDIFVRFGPQRGLDLIRSGGNIVGDP